MRVATFCTRAGLLWKAGGGGVCPAARGVAKDLIRSRCSGRKVVKYLFIFANNVELPEVYWMGMGSSCGCGSTASDCVISISS